MSNERCNVERTYEGLQMAMTHIEGAFGQKYGLGRHSIEHILENVSELEYPENRDLEAEAAARELLPVTALLQAVDIFIAWYAIDKSADGALDAGLELMTIAKYFYNQGNF